MPTEFTSWDSFVHLISCSSPRSWAWTSHRPNFVCRYGRALLVHDSGLWIIYQGFDTCVAEIFGALCYGATLVHRHDDLFSHLQTVDATMTTPSILSALDPKDFANPEMIVVGGESIPSALLERWGPARKVFNSYGPSECTIGSTFCPLFIDQPITLGRPIPRMNVYILDEDLRPVPVSVPGEICLAGIQVTSGYLNQTMETEKRFIRNPFTKIGRLYRTGDRGCWTQGGDTEYIGRTDNLVKLSSALTGVCIIVSNGNLIGFVESADMETTQMIDQLSKLLPRHSLPSVILGMDRLPRTVNQKIDRKSLEQNAWQRNLKQHVEFETATEQIIARIWATVLSREYEQISALDDFVTLGGHSLLQIRASRELSTHFGRSIPLGLVINNPCLPWLAKAVDEYIVTAQERSSVACPFQLSRRLPSSNVALPLSYLEEEMFLWCLMTEHPSAMNVACVLHYPAKVSADRLRIAVDSAIKSYELLRLQYILVNGVPQTILSDQFRKTDIVVSTPGLIQDRLIDIISNTLFDLEKEQPFRSRLVLVCPHIVADKAAISLLIKKIDSFYRESSKRVVGVERGRKNANSQEVTSADLDYIDWANWSRIKSALHGDADRFWNTYLHARPASPFSVPDHIPTSGPGDFRDESLPSPALSSLSSLTSCSRNQLLLGSLALTIYALTEASDIVLGISFHNRNESGTEDVFGLLLDRVPILVLINEPNLSSTEEFFAHIRQSAESAMAHFASYQAIQKSLRKQGDTRHDPFFDSMVAYHSIDDSTGTREFLGGPLDLVLVRPRGGSKFRLMVELTEMQNGTISLCIEYRTTIFTDDYISRLQLTSVEVLSNISKMGPLETLYGIKSQSRAFTEKLQLYFLKSLNI
ncbi:nonribosomal peptide synthetase [Metarhizium robertsii]|uniref:Nonribosomal peptide synthetase n=1 Tax=Metarhizium robertsii TaxID=568076 RepID=A0A014P9L9_9HYPO|nr:nonribosomal peptide synthetase [Metarhizium robertsii]